MLPAPVLAEAAARPHPAAALLPGFLLLTATVSLCVILSVSWIWEHRAQSRRRSLALLSAAGEEILSAGSVTAIHNKLADVLAEFSGATHVHLNLLNRRTQHLERWAAPDEPDASPIDPEHPAAGLAMGVALAFRNRTLFNIPDTRKSAVLVQGFEGPRSVLFVPLLHQGDVLGVIEVDHVTGRRDFSPGQRAGLQHLGNLTAVALKNLDQDGARETSLRTERLAATAQLISAVAVELGPPLDKVHRTANRLLAREDDPEVLAELRKLVLEVSRASDVVARLVSFGRPEQPPSATIEINNLLSILVRRREREWKSAGIEAQLRTSETPLDIGAPRTQIEQVLLNVLGHAERNSAESADRKLSVTTAAAGRRAAIEILYSCPDNSPDPGAELTAWQKLIRGYEGDVRISHPSARTCRLEIEFPLASGESARPAGGERRHRRTATILVVEPDAVFQKKLLADLSAHRHRVVLVQSAEEGIDLAQRMRFDSVFCAIRLPGLNWVEFSERVHDLVGVFVLMIDSSDLANGPWLDPTDGILMNRAAYETDLERVVREVETTLDGENGTAGKPANPRPEA